MRIAIVNDMVMAVEAMKRVLLLARGHELAWVARDGEEAVRRCAQDTPDLVLMDLMMPEMDGVEATRQIMARSPCAIVVVTASVNRNSSKVFEAMSAGALDAVRTPTLGFHSASVGAKALLGKIHTIHRLLGDGNGARMHSRPRDSTADRAIRRQRLIAIGASAGGPAALARVLAALPKDFPAGIVVVQHVDAQFAEGLASWLRTQTKLPVRLAKHGERPEAGTVLLAGTNNHLVFGGPERLAYTSQPADTPYRASIDVFFRSIEKHWRGEVIGVLLTGMGRDGAAGLKVLHGAGHHTIAQDKATSAVYGMPKAAAELKAASEILAVDRIGPRLAHLLHKRTRLHG